jgi:hypothetical protein
MDIEKINSKEWVVEEGHRRAKIIFKEGKFFECNCFGLNDKYTLEDWEFLSIVSNMIIVEDEKNKRLAEALKSLLKKR